MNPKLIYTEEENPRPNSIDNQLISISSKEKENCHKISYGM